MREGGDDGGQIGRGACTSPSGDSARLPRPPYVWVWSAIWLVYLAWPVSSLFAPGVGRVRALGAVAGLLLFVAGYLWPWSPAGWAARPRTLVWSLALTLPIAATLTLIFGPQWGGLFIYSAVLAASLPARRRVLVGLSSVTAMAAACMALAGAGVGEVLSIGVTCALIGTAMAGWMQFLRVAQALRAADRRIARMDVLEERLRIARDIHDLLGHSLSLIALKADLAARLVPADPARAAAEMTAVQAVARQSLAEVRAAVAGYRTLVLDEELARARDALGAAGIRCTVTGGAGGVPVPAGSALAWALREAVTNVLRHSGASACTIAVSRGGGWVELQVEDDGRGAAATAEAGARAGNGLPGLRERLQASGGVLAAAPGPRGGFRLVARVPEAPAADAGPPAAGGRAPAWLGADPAFDGPTGEGLP
jgi:two-component system sensor histidine kinase DesK